MRLDPGAAGWHFDPEIGFAKRIAGFFNLPADNGRSTEGHFAYAHADRALQLGDARDLLIRIGKFLVE